jgi:[ribosomal protein S18]-alanine N-acetyltransferase
VSNAVLRQARRSDLDAILRIEHRVFSDPWSPDSFAPEFDDPYTWFRVAELDSALVGYVVARIVAQQGEIANIAVNPEHQRTGLGGVLLDAAVAAAEAAQCEAVWLEVRLSNDPARRLYASRGFELIGRRRGYYRVPVEDALVLRRTRTPAADAVARK